jgi:tetratricopeptide (TPR) repeat protein/GT2 family glycosyltransferase
MNAVSRIFPREGPKAKERAIRLFDRGAWEQALVAFDRALDETPRDTELHNYRARALDALGRTEEALRAIEQALTIDPGNIADLRNRALLSRRLGRVTDALADFDTLLERNPNDVDVLIRRAHTLAELERRQEALSCAEEALRQHPDNLPALNARGMVLERLERYDEALADFERMLAIRPDDPDAINNRGMIQARCGRFSEAFDSYSRSLSIKPDQPQAFYNRSLVRLALGDWEQGLQEFESRWETAPLRVVRPQLAAPQWMGTEDVADKTLFLYHEQGYGDTLQCARYIARLAGLGARVVLAVPPALRRLMETLDGLPQVITWGEPVPAHDFHCPLMSLMKAFGTTPETIPYSAAYLRADPQAVVVWKQRLGPQRRPRIGVAWSGRGYPPINYPRDVPLSSLKPLFALDADFVSLQTELSEVDRTWFAGFSNVDSHSALGLNAFSDTAALIECLDLVICVDTAVAHLAGALGKPVWLMNRYASCWRWGQNRLESPWYPSMRIFRQADVRDWRGVIEPVLIAAAELIAERAPSTAAESEGHPVGSEVLATPATSAHAATGRRDTIRFVCATRHTAEDFLAKNPLGRSLPLYRTFPRGQRIELRLFKENTEGLSTVYNTAIEESRDDPAILVFIHDDVHLSDYYWADHLLEGLREFDIVGLAGNRRRAPRQASWMYLNDQFQRDADENLSGVLGHGEGFPNLKELSIYGEPRQECKLLDGVLLAVRSRTLIERELRFDTRFQFHFYDLDFCRQAEKRGLRMGTWALSVIHASAGKLGSEEWRAAYREYLAKYED